MVRRTRHRLSIARPSGRPERGVALLLVVFIIALAMIITTDLAYETNLSARLNAYSERSVRAEYILKSAINVARAILRMDESPEDAAQDPTWGPFSEGMKVAARDLGINEPGAEITLEIRPVGAKIRVTNLLTGGRTPQLEWVQVFRRLFEKLGFDNDEEEEDPTGLSGGKKIGVDQMILNLIDYMDRDTDSAKVEGLNGEGIEGNLPDAERRFPNTDPSSFSELQSIPGFTPARMQKLFPYLTVVGDQQVNINVADKIVLQAIFKDADEGEIDNLIAWRQSEQGPFTQANRSQQLKEILGDDPGNINFMITTESRWFTVVAKVDYGTSHYFARAYISHNNSGGSKEKPVIRSIELF